MQADDVNGVDIELRDLRLAVVTSQHRSLRQAAEALNIRQSTLSRRLHEIERQLGVVLFERTNGGTREPRRESWRLQLLSRMEQWKSGRHRTDIHLRSANARCGWCWSMA
ncbi:LysR family transcriptional regulator, partial [Acidiphilium sp. AL]|uniref:helix-turn-helix domain-containing protein n=1 Tax=Acidiphilium sp. AL TaxID=2871704 RepID=UPI0021CB3DC9